MKQTDDKLEMFLEQYDKRKRSISVNFRTIVDGLSSSRFTHLIHPYPAKLLTHIPHFFLSNSVLSKQSDIVLDPFCGSGTVLLEAQIAGRNALGADSSPLARLISKVKTCPLDEKKLTSALKRIMARIPSSLITEPPDVINLEYWFYPHIVKQLCCILQAIKKTRNPDVKDFFMICFSCCVKKVSLADPRLSVPVRLKQGQYPKGHVLREKTDAHIRKLRRANVSKVFYKIALSNIKRMSNLEKIKTGCESHIISSDARALATGHPFMDFESGVLPDNSVQLVITSPPYAGAQKYIRSVSLNLGWLEMCAAEQIKDYKNLTIGREEFRKEHLSELMPTGIPSADKLLAEIREINPIRSHIASTYLLEMKQALAEMSRVLKNDGYLVLVCANNTVCGKEFKTSYYLRRIAESLGFSIKLSMIDDIVSRGLMTKRNKTASIITREWVMLFQKAKPYGRS